MIGRCSVSYGTRTTASYSRAFIERNKQTKRERWKQNKERDEEEESSVKKNRILKYEINVLPSFPNI
jgi:hypothetical protein